MKEYYNSLEFWDDYFGKEIPEKLVEPIQIAPEFDAELEKFASDCPSILDYGCGNATLLFMCASFRKLNKGLGIDPSINAMQYNYEMAKLNGYENLEFKVGSVDSLYSIEDESFSGIIISNVIDVIEPILVEEILEQINRLLTIEGLVLLKLNPFVTKEYIEKIGGSEFEPNMIEKNGVLRLCNYQTDYWNKLLSRYFNIINYIEFPYPGSKEQNRLFLLKKRFNITII